MKFSDIPGISVRHKFILYIRAHEYGVVIIPVLSIKQKYTRIYKIVPSTRNGFDSMYIIEISLS